MKIIVTGACGLLGAHLMAACSRRHDVLGIDRHPWWGDQAFTVVAGDIAAPGVLADAMARFVPEVLIHCAAMVNVDACEQDPDQAYAGNAGLTRKVVRAAPPGCLIVYVSTDSVFKGDEPYAREEHIPCPRTVYARSKLQGEWEVAQATGHHLILRTNFYGWSSGRKKTFAEWLYNALVARQPITLFDDFFFTPIYVVDFVERLIHLIEGGYRGTFHLAGRDRVSKYEFGMFMAKVASLSVDQVRRGLLEQAGLRAPRPKDMSLKSEQFERMTGIPVPRCLSGLERFIADQHRPLSARVATLDEAKIPRLLGI